MSQSPMPVGLRFFFAATGQGVGLQKPWAMRSARSRHDAVLFGLAAMPCNICYCEAAYIIPAGPRYWGKGHHIHTNNKTEHKHTDERRYRLPSSQELVNGLDDIPWLTFCHVLNAIASYAALPAPCAPLNLKKIIRLQREPLREPAMTMHALITLDAWMSQIRAWHMAFPPDRQLPHQKTNLHTSQMCASAFPINALIDAPTATSFALHMHLRLQRQVTSAPDHDATNEEPSGRKHAYLPATVDQACHSGAQIAPLLASPGRCRPQRAIGVKECECLLQLPVASAIPH